MGFTVNKKTERIGKLIEILKVRGYVSIHELSSMLGVSEMTVRRDLRLLEQNRVAENVDGTSVYNPAHTLTRDDMGYNLLGEMQKRNEQKDDIGRLAATLVKKNDIVIMDTGTTTERIVQHLPTHLDITVLCYNINILMELRRNPGVRMLFAGGRYHPNTQMFESEEGIQYIRGLRACKVFLSASGVHSELGVTCANSYEVPTKRAIIRSSVEKILVADSSKFGAVRPAYFCDLTEVNAVITDRGLSEEWQNKLKEMGIQLYLA